MKNDFFKQLLSTQMSIPTAPLLYVLFQCEGVQLLLEGLGGQRGAQLEGLEQDVGRLKEWASGLTEKQAQLQSSLTSLRDAVGQIEQRTSAITKDFANKVFSSSFSFSF